ncbi:class I SAM-dependent DNA methyltransferase [Rhodocytophaga rosea]|uniref:site-specific DNA-methyltransferase (adenine-specific) n=1 Tax=Rhodocytophaga rosea TaxID=2704465 RepID=A0A6C0GCS4_9BACT|nr:DNA methyltransferase [Rhodocytophaga rosea]QHT65678.1 class I SAM-dependent DNA methyltransferase [Rhodocytophaga rosea]
MALSWNEIKDRAIRFSKEWQDTEREEADAKPFLVEFFNIFGISSKRVSTFEHKVKKLSQADGYIDLLWKGVILVEMKSRGKNLDKAYQQAINYFPGLKEYDLPKYILVSDFERFRLYDLEEGTHQEFLLKDLYQNVKLFGFILGYQTKSYKSEDPVNILAAERMGKLHDRLKEIGYEGHELEVYLVRILFCLFAEDTSIFEKRLFQDYIERKTNEDGSDLAAHLAQLFHILNTPQQKRLKNIDEHLNQFPYVNGKLFAEYLPPASFDSKMRELLLHCCALDWSKISPAIFGSLFQSVMNPIERRNLGAHYTSEKNILKLIKPLFLDELWREFESIKTNRNKLTEFHKKLSTLKFLDPACGCGNFLVITYRELRLLEIEILRALNKSGQGWLNVSDIIWLDVDMVYGIEYEEFPARIAEVAMWLIDHQMNMQISVEFGQYFARLPLKKSANITHGNALRLDWESIVPKNQLTYILGNPPFVGKSNQNAVQKADMDKVFIKVDGAGVLDYVTAWYIKAARYIQDTTIKAAFVSTNSIVQGEQVGILWNELFSKYKVKIHFAHRTFNWKNEARGNAAVHVVIIGFANFDINEKYIYEYENIKAEPHELKAKNINPYLVEGKDLVILGRTIPLNNVPKMIYGSKPVDDGNFFFSDDEKELFIQKEPNAIKYIKPVLSSHQFLNGQNRWCLWLENITPDELKKMPFVLKRLENIKNFRALSTKESVKKQAATPMLFSEIRQPKSSYIIIPRHSSESRKYIPFGFFEPEIIVSDSCTALPNAALFHFGILTSEMHNVWIRHICGRIKSDFRYSNVLVYNNFPWPESPNEKQIKAIETAAQKVLDARKAFPDSSLADLYDSLTMPPILVKAHQELDKAVDLCYRPQAFVSEAKRMEFLFELYEKYTAGLFAKEKPKTKKKESAQAIE